MANVANVANVLYISYQVLVRFFFYRDPNIYILIPLMHHVLLKISILCLYSTDRTNASSL